VLFLSLQLDKTTQLVYHPAHCCCVIYIGASLHSPRRLATHQALLRKDGQTDDVTLLLKDLSPSCALTPGQEENHDTAPAMNSCNMAEGAVGTMLRNITRSSGLQAFRRNLLPQPSGCKSRPNKQADHRRGFNSTVMQEDTRASLVWLRGGPLRLRMQRTP
jgi:hypothetical protein